MAASALAEESGMRACRVESAALEKERNEAKERKRLRRRGCLVTMRAWERRFLSPGEPPSARC